MLSKTTNHMHARRPHNASKGMYMCMSSSVDLREGAIDVHTHMYLPKYMDILRKRSDVPYVRDIAGIRMHMDTCIHPTMHSFMLPCVHTYAYMCTDTYTYTYTRTYIKICLTSIYIQTLPRGKSSSNLTW